MAKLSPQGPFRALDGNGDPLAGGKLYTYEAGTTTPKDTYTDAGGLTPNANPVVLDSEGYADVWLGDGSYKFILKDSADVTQWTVDDITGDTAAAFGSQVVTQATNLAITDVYSQAIINCTATLTLTLLPAATAGSGFYFVVKNQSASGVVTIDPDGAETINGASTQTLSYGEGAVVYTNGTAWFTVFNTPSDLGVSNLRAGTGASTITSTSTRPIQLKSTGSTDVFQRFSNGLTSSSGFEVGIDTAHNAYVSNNQAANLILGTNSANKITITSTTTTFADPVVMSSTLSTTGIATLAAASLLASSPTSNDSSTKIATTAFVNPANLQADDGYVKLPSGVVIQWGNESVTTAIGNISFPLTFPTTCWLVVGIAGTRYGGSDLSVSGTLPIFATDNFSTTQFRYQTNNNAGGSISGTEILRWVAIGN